MSTEKKYKTFKEYYSDPEYKKKHLEQQAEKIICDCGVTIAKYNLSRHKKTQKHIILKENKQLKGK